MSHIRLQAKESDLWMPERLLATFERQKLYMNIFITLYLTWKLSGCTVRPRMLWWNVLFRPLRSWNNLKDMIMAIRNNGIRWLSNVVVDTDWQLSLNYGPVAANNAQLVTTYIGYQMPFCEVDSYTSCKKYVIGCTTHQFERWSLIKVEWYVMTWQRPFLRFPLRRSVSFEEHFWLHPDMSLVSRMSLDILT